MANKDITELVKKDIQEYNFSYPMSNIYIYLVHEILNSKLPQFKMWLKYLGLNIWILTNYLTYQNQTEQIY